MGRWDKMRGGGSRCGDFQSSWIFYLCLVVELEGVMVENRG